MRKCCLSLEDERRRLSSRLNEALIAKVCKCLRNQMQREGMVMVGLVAPIARMSTGRAVVKIRNWKRVRVMLPTLFVVLVLASVVQAQESFCELLMALSKLSRFSSFHSR